jgi:hypothetical protein
MQSLQGRAQSDHGDLSTGYRRPITVQLGSRFEDARDEQAVSASSLIIPPHRSEIRESELRAPHIVGRRTREGGGELVEVDRRVWDIRLAQ